MSVVNEWDRPINQKVSSNSNHISNYPAPSLTDPNRYSKHYSIPSTLGVSQNLDWPIKRFSLGKFTSGKPEWGTWRSRCRWTADCGGVLWTRCVRRVSCERWSRWTASSWRTCWRWWWNAALVPESVERSSRRSRCPFFRCRCQNTCHLTPAGNIHSLAQPNCRLCIVL